MSDSLIITDEYIATTLAGIPGFVADGRAPIQTFSKIVQSALVAHVVVGPGLTVQDVFARASAEIGDAALADDGRVYIAGRQAGLWLAFLFWHEASDADINAIAVLPMPGDGGPDLNFIRDMDYLRDGLSAAQPPLYYMAVSTAFADDGNTRIGISVEPDMVGYALLAMDFVKREGLGVAR